MSFLLLMAIWSCNGGEEKSPDPHLELGQRIFFVGGPPEKTYVVIGYRQLLEDKTDKNWNDHDYIVFSYANDQGDIKEAVIHRNAILKK